MELTQTPRVYAARCRRWATVVTGAVMVAGGWMGLSGCDGRSLGVDDPGNNHRRDGTISPGWDSGGWDSGGQPGPDGSVVTCQDSPLQGIWLGAFEGTVTSPDVGTLPVSGSVRLEIFCEFDLIVSGELTGSEAGGVPFRMDVTGRYYDDLDTMEATFSGYVDQYPATGNLMGNLQSGWPDSLIGGWDVQVDDWDMTGNGHWSASLD